MKPNTYPARTEARQEPRLPLPVLSPSPTVPRPLAAIQAREDDFLSSLRGKRVRVCSLFGASVAGELVGIAKYEIKVRQQEGAEVVIPKGGVWTVEEMVP